MKTRSLIPAAFALALGGAATAEQVINDDLVVSGDACIGPDCVTSDAFNSNGLKIKADNPLVVFDDTTNPWSREWSIVGLSNSEGTSGVLAVREHITAGGSTRAPFIINRGAFSSSINISSSSQIGFSTSMPEQDLHIVKPLAPAIRLEQDTSGGQPSHTWDMSAGNNGFLIVDVGNPFSVVPFTIENGAEPGAFHIDATGTVGLGTTTPSTGLHVWDNTGQGAILIEETSAGTLGQMTLRNNGITFFTLEDTSIAAGDNTGRAWNFQNQAGTFRITTAPGGPGEIEMIMTPAGDMTIKGSLTTGGGTCGGGCDAVFSDGYDLPSISEHAEAMWSLGHLPNVGPTVENEPINVSDKLGRMLNELEHAHIYIDQLQAEISVLKAEKAQLGTEVAEIKTLLTQLIEAQ